MPKLTAEEDWRLNMLKEHGALAATDDEDKIVFQRLRDLGYAEFCPGSRVATEITTKGLRYLREPRNVLV